MATFSSLGVQKNYIKAIKELGISSPSEIQEKTIPVLLKSATDFIGLAQTGTGKTAAFGLPVLHHIDTSSDDIQALILSPTRELVQQIKKQLFKKWLFILSTICIVEIEVRKILLLIFKHSGLRITHYWLLLVWT